LPNLQKNRQKREKQKIAITKLLAIAKPAIDEDDYSEPVDLELELQNSKSRLQNSQNSETNFQDLTVLSEIKKRHLEIDIFTTFLSQFLQNTNGLKVLKLL
jgi:hypothetical protein